MSSAALRTMRKLGLEPDPWQLDVLQGRQLRLLLNCCRQAGKSTCVAVHALLHALFGGPLLILLVSPSLRQSAELFGTLVRFFERLGSPFRNRQNAQELTLTNGSRIVSLPCKEATIRGFAGVGLLIIDEAARVPDDVYYAVRPMLGVSAGRLICMSTPFGKRGFFYDAWAKGGDDWQRIQIPAEQVPRISPAFLAQERRCMRPAKFAQEYQCSFEAVEGLVFPDMARCVINQLPPEFQAAAAILSRRHPVTVSPGHLVTSSPRVPLPEGAKCVGGIDFGFRNPFAAVWGLLDANCNLWLVGEHYQRERPISYHATQLPREVMWHADPSGASERAELIKAGFKVRLGKNAIESGIAAVAARIQTGGLRILAGTCPNLLAEANLYRYDADGHSETPVDEHNHALAALRYLVSRIEIARALRRSGDSRYDETLDGPPAAKEKPKKRDPWLRYDNEALWTRIW